MGRCHHIAANGRECSRAARGDDHFCYIHEPEPVDEFAGRGAPLRKTVFRLVALLLLTIFGLQTYQMLKALLGW